MVELFLELTVKSKELYSTHPKIPLKMNDILICLLLSLFFKKMIDIYLLSFAYGHQKLALYLIRNWF